MNSRVGKIDVSRRQSIFKLCIKFHTFILSPRDTVEGLNVSGGQHI